MLSTRIILACCLICAVAPVCAKGIKPGQWTIAGLQNICLKPDGTWYGTTFNFGGHWINDPPSAKDRAAIYGGYQIQGHGYQGYGNTAITIKTFVHRQIAADWYDWFDDFSYEAFLPDFGATFVKTECDAQFNGENTKAPTQ
ncbi:MAG TPA: hypothetical protein VLC74_00755 [Rhizomicrobium sp.]|nr:hypothetical protein [Rhizomicrobium sp.]